MSSSVRVRELEVLVMALEAGSIWRESKVKVSVSSMMAWRALVPGELASNDSAEGVDISDLFPVQGIGYVLVNYL